MKRRTILKGALVGVVGLSGCTSSGGDGADGGGSGATGTGTETETRTRTATAGDRLTATETTEPTPTETETETATPGATETETATPGATETETATPTWTPSGTRTPRRGSAPLASGVVDRTLTDEGGCKQGKRDPTEPSSGASIEFDGDRVVVTGYFVTSTPCYFVDVVGSRARDGTYAITLTAKQNDADACMECVGRIDYEAEITFESLPGTVEVRHGSRPVAERSR